MKRFVIPALLFTSALSVLPISASADPSEVRVLDGEHRVSGNGQCAYIEGTKYIISFRKVLPKVPSVEIQTTVTDPKDRLDARVVEEHNDHAVIEATANGVNGHQICATAFIKWTASY